MIEPQPWIEPPAKVKPARMHVTVTTKGGYVHEYDGLFVSTFDAYNDALDRYQEFVSRIEVEDPRNPSKKGPSK